MGKDVFLAELRERLAGLPQTDVQNSVDYYAEMIDERIEDGICEEDAVREVGSPDEIAAQILSDIPLPRLVREKVRKRRSMRAWEIVLLVFGAPLWLPLLLAFAAVVLTLYAADFSLLSGAAVAAAASAAAVLQGLPLPATAYVGIAMCSAGLAIFLFFGCNALAKGVLRLSRAIVLRVKSGFVRKEAA